MHYCSLVAYQIQVMSFSTYETKCSHLAEIEEKKQQSDCKQEGHQQLVSELRFHPEQHSLLFSHWGMVITFFHRSANPKIQKAHHSHNSKGYLLLFSCVKDLVLAKLGGGGQSRQKQMCQLSVCLWYHRAGVDPGRPLMSNHIFVLQ